MSDVFNKVFRRVTVTSTSLGPSNEINASVEGLDGETDDGLLYGTLGILANPKPQDADGAATGIAAVGQDELSTMATFDRRLAVARGPLPTGTISLPGYEGQHVTTHAGAVPGQAKITIEVGGAKAVFTSGTPAGTVDVTGAGTAENVALFAATQNFVTEILGFVELLCVGKLDAVPTPVPPVLGTLIAASVIPGPVQALLTTAIATSYAQVTAAALAATNPAVASSSVLRASPT